MGSGNELVHYSRARCLGAGQKARGLWERDWLKNHTHVFERSKEVYMNEKRW